MNYNPVSLTRLKFIIFTQIKIYSISKLFLFLIIYNYRHVNYLVINMKKRNLIASLTLSLSLMFSKPRLNYSQLSSPNFGNKVAQVKFIDDKEFWSLEDNDESLVILIKNQSSSKPATVRLGVAESLTSQGHFKKPSGRNLNGSKRNNFPSPRLISFTLISYFFKK
nr:hypothetical protein [Cylindrotheca closterium]ULD16254.1 hypothetical protein [Cylindrotheca closterium]